ncbi:unnamed protein product [Laminaria digitata]
MMKRNLFGAAAVTALSFTALQANAQTQWIEDTLSDQCSTASQQTIANNTRNSIEASVRRAEASIQEPASIADLSCMNDLFNANIDVFSKSWNGFGGFNIEGMINDIAGGLKSGLSIQTLSGGVERAICSFAQEQFSELTSGVTSGIGDLLDPSTVLSQMPNFTDGFSSLNIPISTSTGSSRQDLDGDGGNVSGNAGGNASATPAGPDGTNNDSSVDIDAIWRSISGVN